jgi:Ras-related protein Rab-6A
LGSQVTPEDLDKRAKELGVMSIETSAKAGHNVKALFKKIAMALPGGAEAKDATANQSKFSSALIVNVRIQADWNRDRR